METTAKHEWTVTGPTVIGERMSYRVWDGVHERAVIPVVADSNGERELAYARKCASVLDLYDALKDCVGALGKYLRSVESGKDDDAESAYQYGWEILAKIDAKKEVDCLICMRFISFQR
ncbi:MAG: hypothetical protein V2A79_10155 [Planctomycetota bacterium]